MGEVEKLRALLAEARELLGEARHLKCEWGFERCGFCQRIEAALAEPVEDEPVAIRFGSPVYACLDCGYCDEGLTLTWQDGEPARAMCVKCRQGRVEHIEGGVAALVREREEARAEVAAAYQRGAEAMREAAVEACQPLLRSLAYRGDIADKIRAMPLPEEKP